MSDKKLLISESTVNRILAVLANLPYGQVADTVDAVKRDLLTLNTEEVKEDATENQDTNGNG